MRRAARHRRLNARLNILAEKTLGMHRFPSRVVQRGVDGDAGVRAGAERPWSR